MGQRCVVRDKVRGDEVDDVSVGCVLSLEGRYHVVERVVRPIDGGHARVELRRLSALEEDELTRTWDG